ncbi:MAG: PilN domain-containing protein [Patescibacteria group bacterium]|jgi:Tfp pilus assembly protein PilN
MAARKKKNKINLLPQEEFAASTLGRILTWLVSSFRVIVIVTEVVVMLAFLSRFWLDAKSADLGDLIKQRETVIASSADFEKEFRGAQKRLKIFSGLTTTDGTTAQYLNNISSLIPPEIVLTSLSFLGEEIKLEGVSPSEIGIAQLVANLEASDNFKEVSISQINTDKETQVLLKFLIKITLKGGK